jgi:UDP-N-acetylglucosamine 2-epimerase (non-hydrolysing)/GDP/UDP-N,N'-diacetylbacillosamine 2-epimerase (hydrolysing)
MTPKNLSDLAAQTGLAIAQLARQFQKLKTDIVIVVGDRVEAFAAASAAHISQKIVAHIHGGDRAPGQIDDSLRHAISKLAHLHFPATRSSGQRLLRLGEDRWRVHVVGSPGIDGITREAASAQQVRDSFPNLHPGKFALIVLHPMGRERDIEFKRAEMVLAAIHRTGIPQTVVIYPNNDPGSSQIIRCWKSHRNQITYLLKDISRPLFLGLMRDAAVMVGNSSSGIIEAASFRMPVVDIGPRQLGRERSENVVNVPYSQASIGRALRRVWNEGLPGRWRGRNVYGGNRTAEKIAQTLASMDLPSPRLRRKLIAH